MKTNKCLTALSVIIDIKQEDHFLLHQKETPIKAQVWCSLCIFENNNEVTVPKKKLYPCDVCVQQRIYPCKSD